MKHKLLKIFMVCFFCCAASMAFAQNQTVTGTVTSQDEGLPIPGVTVKIKGSSQGTQTGTDGKYTVNVANGTTLVFSFIGYATQEVVVTKNIMNVVLILSSKQLGEIVVTGLGISKAKKTLGYAQTTVKNEDINRSAPNNPFGALQGKVAGVNISNVGGSAGGSTKIILRGYTSLTGTNQPLFIIDGVPLDNSRRGSDDNFDFGNNANDIDPNQIDNISILKGSAATAIYGSRGSNGVIVITTKKGKSGKPVVEFSSAATMTDLAFVYKPQDVFGQGWDGHFVLGENGNWGPKYTGLTQPWGAVVDNTQLLRPFSFIQNNVRDAFDRGIDLNNNISISGGTDATTYLFSYNNIYSNGILPGPADKFKRNNFTLKGSTTYKNFSIDASLNYVGKNGNFVATGQGPTGIASTFYENILQIPGSVPIKDLRDYKNQYFNIDNYYTPFAVNPFYSLNENGSHSKNDRFYGNVNMNYKVTDWLTLNFQQGADVSNMGNKIWFNSNYPTPGSWVGGANTESAVRKPDVGSVEEDNFQNFEYDSKLQALFNKKFSNFEINGLLGANYNDRGSRSHISRIEGLAIPDFFNLSNSSNQPFASEEEIHRRLLAFYGQATIGYKDYLYLTVTGRNDITSTLATGNNSYFYPAANLSYVLSQALGINSSKVTYIKLRGSYGETGSDTDPYSTLNVLNATSVPLGFGNLTFPFQGVPGFSVANTLYTSGLKPERVKEYEVGGEFRFLDDRIGLDLTYYHKVRQDQILNVPIAPSTGYASQLINFGKVKETGIEVAFNATPVKSSVVKWDFTYTFSRNRSTVVSLPPGLEKVILGQDGYGGQFVAVAGQPLGLLQAPVPAYDPQGHIIVDGGGYPVAAAANGTYGNFQHDFVMGFTNSVRVKDFTLGFTLEWDKGGKFYSGTADLFNFVGADPKTLYNDRNPFVVPNSVQRVIDASGAVIGYTENNTPISEANNDDYYYTTSNKALAWSRDILDRSFMKLREVTLNYNLPKSFISKIGASKASVGIYGRNLITWLPAGNRVVDPEVSNYGTDLASEYGEFRTAPPLRYYGASLKVTF